MDSVTAIVTLLTEQALMRGDSLNTGIEAVAPRGRSQQSETVEKGNGIGEKAVMEFKPCLLKIMDVRECLATLKASGRLTRITEAEDLCR